jgi:acetyltransferase-like isoleucine patch superfamily enzyme
VEIGTGSVIGTGAVVRETIPPDSLAVGIPARIIKSRELNSQIEI